MEMWPQGLVWPSLSGLIIFQVPLALPALMQSSLMQP